MKLNETFLLIFLLISVWLRCCVCLKETQLKLLINRINNKNTKLSQQHGMNLNQARTFKLAVDKRIDSSKRLSFKPNRQRNFPKSCKSNEKEPSNMAYLAPTVLEVAATEKFIKSSSTNGLDSYSMLFQIRRILKYEGKLVHEVNTIGDISQSINASSADLNKLAEQSNRRDLTNIDSLIMIENFVNDVDAHEELESEHRTHYKRACLKANIELNQTYFLFLDSRLPMANNQQESKFFTYPVKLTQDSRQANKWQRLLKSWIVLAKVPIFELFARPLPFSSLTNRLIENILCQNCGIH
jgi:hypothetical protein